MIVSLLSPAHSDPRIPSDAQRETIFDSPIHPLRSISEEPAQFRVGNVNVGNQDSSLQVIRQSWAVAVHASSFVLVTSALCVCCPSLLSFYTKHNHLQFLPFSSS